jgi:hypothetical protein
MTQVVALIFNPEGRAGFMVHAIMADPRLLSVVGVTLMTEPTKPVTPVEPV